MVPEPTRKNRGYILLYTILAASLFAVLATGILAVTLRELDLSEQSIEAAKARWAAEAGAECIQFWDRGLPASALNTTVPGFINISCVTEGATVIEEFTKDAEGTAECVGWDRTFLINPIFAGGTSCAEVRVEIEPIAVFPEACKVKIRSRGFNDCTTRAVERIVWTDELGA